MNNLWENFVEGMPEWYMYKKNVDIGIYFI